MYVLFFEQLTNDTWNYLIIIIWLNTIKLYYLNSSLICQDYIKNLKYMYISIINNQ